MPISQPKPPRKKGKMLRVRVDDELYDDANAYVEERGFSLGALIRALLKRQVDRNDPRPPPPGIEQEVKRPPRRKNQKPPAE